MSRLIAAAVLLIFIVACCVAGSIAVGSCCEQLDELLTAAHDAAEQDDLVRAGRFAQSAESAYTEGEFALFMFIDHSLVESVGEQLALLPHLAAPETRDEFLSQLDSVKVTLTHIERDNRPALRSVL